MADSLTGTAPSKPRVLIFATTVPTREDDGTPAFVLTLAKRLLPDYDLLVLAPRVRGSERFQRVHGVPIRRFPYFPRRWERLADAGIVAAIQADRLRLLQVPTFLCSFMIAAVYWTIRFRPRIIHAHWILPSGTVALLVRRTLGVPYLVTAHGIDVYGMQGSAFRFVKRLTLAGACLVTSTSRDLARELGFDEARMARFTIPMGIDTAFIRTKIGSRKAQSGRFLFVGRLVAKKGVDVLLDAMARLDEGTLTIVGDGPRMAELREHSARLGIADRVTFVGQQPYESVIAHLKEAFTLVVPLQGWRRRRQGHDATRDE